MMKSLLNVHSSINNIFIGGPPIPSPTNPLLTTWPFVLSLAKKQLNLFLLFKIQFIVIQFVNIIRELFTSHF